MRVAKIAIRNILGIEELEVEPGTVTVIEGANAAGKTSVMEAVRSLVEGGHDATLLRHGAEKGEVVMVLDDGTRVTKTVTAARSATTAMHPEYGRLAGPAGWLNGIFDTLFNPVAFIASTAKDRVRALIEALPADPDHDAIGAVVREAGYGYTPGKEDHALDAIAAVRDRLYRARTGENRAAKDAETYAAQLAKSLPEGEIEDADVGAATGALDAAKAAEQAAMAELDNEFHLKRTEIRRKKDEHHGKLDEDIRTLESEIDNLISRKASVAGEAHKLAEKARDEMGDQARELREAARPEIERLTVARAEAVERAASADRDANTRALVEERRAVAGAAKAKSAAITAALAKLDTMRECVAEDLPGDGLEIADGDVTQHGVPFTRLNSAAQVRLALGVARMRAGKVPLVILDGMERLDADQFAAVKTEIEGAGDIQAIMARVSDGPLKVSGS